MVESLLFSVTDEINIGSINNQNFVLIPHCTFINMLSYKYIEKGINLIISEESYTSKASFLDMDEIPTYKKDNEKKHIFSGKRVFRGLYKSKNGTLINADVNGAYNIVRKVYPKAFDVEGVAGFVSTPVAVAIRYPRRSA